MSNKRRTKEKGSHEGSEFIIFPLIIYILLLSVSVEKLMQILNWH